MYLNKLFETQAELDNRIVEKKGLQGQDLLDKEILALQVELGELANEWRGFKFWSENQEPNRTGYIECDVCTDQPGRYEVIVGDEVVSLPCQKCDGHEEVYVGDRLLEEYVDCLHFILSIGNEFNYTFKKRELVECETTNEVFLSLYELIAGFDKNCLEGVYYSLFNRFVDLGEQLGFTWEQIEQAYFDKNKVNHQRQMNGY